MHDTSSVLRSLALFVIAGVCEIGGGWLMWKWLRDGKPGWWGLGGAVILMLYGVIPTLQAAHFGRVYAVYGGFFIVLSLVWGWYFDGNRPDRADVIGAGIALVGVCVMLYYPRAGACVDTEQSSTGGMPLTTAKRVVFVCVENSNRSQMAEAFARIHGQGRIEAHSAGSRPSGIVNRKAEEAMTEKGYDLAEHHSKSLGQLPTGEYDVAVSMGCGDACPMVTAKRREEWQIPDPKHLSPDEFRAVRDLIERKVIELLASV